jgi:hypothetical protein
VPKAAIDVFNINLKLDAFLDISYLRLE